MINYPEPTNNQKDGGWKVNFQFLQKIQNKINHEDGKPSLEQIEEILLALKNIMDGD